MRNRQSQYRASIDTPSMRGGKLQAQLKGLAYDTYAIGEVSTIDVKAVDDMLGRVDEGLNTIAARAVYKEEQEESLEKFDKQDVGFEYMRKDDPEGNYTRDVVSGRDVLAGHSPMGTKGQVKYYKDGNLIPGHTLEALYHTNSAKDYLDIPDKKGFSDLTLGRQMYFGKASGMDWGDIFGEDGIFSVLGKRLFGNMKEWRENKENFMGNRKNRFWKQGEGN